MVRILAAVCLLSVASTASAQYANDVERRLAVGEYHIGLQKLDAGAYDQAAAAFVRAIRHDKNLPIAYYALGQAHAARQRWDLAIEAYAGGVQALHAIDLYTREVRGAVDNREDVVRREEALLNARSSDPFQRGGRGSLAITLADRVRNTAYQQGRSFEAELALATGSAFYHAGKYAEAENEWRYAVSLWPELGEGWNNLAALYADHHLKAPAEEALKAAERAGYSVAPGLKQQIAALR